MYHGPADHHVVDIELNRPVINAGAWKLSVSGDVAAPRYNRRAELPTPLGRDGVSPCAGESRVRKGASRAWELRFKGLRGEG